MKVWNKDSSYQELQLLKQHFVLTRTREQDREKCELIETGIIELIQEGKLIGEIRNGEVQFCVVK